MAIDQNHFKQQDQTSGPDLVSPNCCTSHIWEWHQRRFSLQSKVLKFRVQRSKSNRSLSEDQTFHPVQAVFFTAAEADTVGGVEGPMSFNQIFFFKTCNSLQSVDVLHGETQTIRQRNPNRASGRRCCRFPA